MKLSDYLLFVGILAVVLATQLGRREPSARRLAMPVLIVALVGEKYLKTIPSGNTSHLLEIGGLLSGIALGALALACIGVQRSSASGKLVTVAGWPYAAVWSAASIGRLAFAYGATHWFAGSLRSFSQAHGVVASTYAVAFVLMVLAMITVRTVGVALRGYRIGARIGFDELAAGSRVLARLR